MASPERRRVVESAYAAMPGLKRHARCLAPIGCLHCRCDKGGGLRQAASCLRLRQGGPPMKRHPNARVAPRGREALASRVRAGERVSDAARQMGAGRQTASKRLARDRLGEGAADRSSRPPRIARAPPEAGWRVVVYVVKYKSTLGDADVFPTQNVLCRESQRHPVLDGTHPSR